jgi:hypothetical protein
MNIMLSTLTSAIRDLPGIFHERRQPLSYDELFKDSKDGCALYDDVWGG